MANLRAPHLSIIVIKSLKKISNIYIMFHWEALLQHMAYCLVCRAIVVTEQWCQIVPNYFIQIALDLKKRLC